MSGGATRITNLGREEMLCPINMDRLQKYNIQRKKQKKSLLGRKPERAAQEKINAKEPLQIENPKGRSRKKLGEMTIGMAKIPARTSWAKITWQRKKKRKKQKKKKKKKKKRKTKNKKKE